MSTLGAREQAGVLTERYVMCWLGDPGTLALLVLQAPFIGWLCTIVWGSVETDTPSLRFVLCLSAVWFGCTSACREIVKERAIVERERFFGLSLPAYVASRYAVLGGLTLVQVLTLQLAVEWSIQLSGAFLVQTVALWGVALCGVGLGLVVSALSRREARAVGAVPLLILPQILFSEVALPLEAMADVVTTLQKAMPVHWAYRVFSEGAAAETSWLAIAGALLALGVYASGLALLSTAALLPRRGT